MIITNLDINIIKFLNDFGIASRATISDMFFCDKKNKRKLAEKRLRRLFNNDFVIREKCHRSGNFVYSLTNKAIEFLRAEGVLTYGLITKFPWGKMVHEYFIHKAVIEFFKNGVTDFISERKLKLDSKIRQFVPDFVARIDDDYLIAVEVEKESKTKDRIYEKLVKINRSKLFKVVLYITCEDRILRNVNKFYQKLKEPYFQLVTVSHMDFFDNSSKYITPLINTARGWY